MENFTDQHTRNKMETSTEAILEIENTINKKLPIDDLSEIFLHDSYLVGGCVRDAVWNKIIEDTDLDIYTRMTQNELVRELKKLGYSESKDINFTGNKYFFDENGLYSYFVFRNKKIEVKFIQDEKIENIANLSDINFNCCAYCINNKKIVYDKEIDLIQNKIL